MPQLHDFNAIMAKRNSLSPKLRSAAEFINANPVEVATRSLRSLAAASGLSPATFSRLARALGFENYEELREITRVEVGQSVSNFSRKAELLQAQSKCGAQPPFLQSQSRACIDNIQALTGSIDPGTLETVVDKLHRARSVLVVGGLGSTGVVEYLNYMASYFTGNWQVAPRRGVSTGAILRDLSAKDVLMVITKPPFAQGSIRAAEIAARQGVFVVLITDNPACPALGHASASFIVPTESPQFFSSYAATLVLVETVIGMLVTRAGRNARRRIAEAERNNRFLQDI